MCGIVGFTGRVNLALAQRLNNCQIHRGPDDQGIVQLPEHNVTLAMRRLAIQDIEGGHQPMWLDGHNICIVFNGEIFNAPELRADLERDGFPFKSSHSDTEVLLNLYMRDGREMLRKLNGMFAFVLFDERREILFGARDRFGIKPLFFTLSNGRFAFSSELKTLLRLPWLSQTINPQAISDYLSFQFSPAPATVFREIRKVPAGHFFQFDLTSQSLVLDRYWKPSFEPDQSISRSAAIDMIVEQLGEATGRWLQSDVPVGFSLSGGLDSSALVALSASRSKIPLKTYTLGFAGKPELDETALARLVSRKFGTEHREIVVTDQDLLSELPAMLAALDEPYAGGLPSWFVFRAMSEDVKVGITGTGGDELFGNYGKWRPFRLPLFAFRKVAQNLRDGGSLGDFLRFRRAFFSHMYFRDSSKKTILQRNFSALLSSPSEDLIESIWIQTGQSDSRNAVCALDLELQLPEEFLMMTDRFSMAHSLEARTPFLDSVLVDRVLSIPPSIRTSRNQPKRLLAEAMEMLLPADVITGKKRGFVLPYADWLRTGLASDVHRLLDPKFLENQGIFSSSIYAGIVKPFFGGDNSRTWQVWTLLMLQMWFENVYEN
jgi:asparagine synthase (glutamine-hydrolysing)